MSLPPVTHWLAAIVLAAPVTLASADTVAPAGQPAGNEIELLRQQVQNQQRVIDRQQQRLSTLEQKDEQGWMTRRRAEEIKSLVRQVLSDADTRASLLDSAITAGHNGKNFFLASEDGKYLLNIGGQFQIRYIYNHRDDSPAGSGNDENQSGFSLRRTKFWFDGYIVDPKISYKLQVVADRKTGNIALEEAYLAYVVTDELTAIIGRLKAPLTREYLISSARNLAVEPSYVDGIFNGGYADAVALVYTHDWLKLTGAFSDGAGSGNTSTANKDFTGDSVDYAFTGRVDVKLQGDWKQWNDFSSWSDDKSPALFLGAAVHYQAAETGESGATATANNEILRWTVDASYKNSGFNIYGAVIGNHLFPEAGDNQDSYGYVVQGGYFVIPDKLEPYARYELYDPYNAPSVGLVTLGANYYLHKHDAKLTLDVVWALDPVATSSDGIGIQTDNDSNQLAIRAGVQVLF